MIELDDCGKTISILVRNGHYIKEQSSSAKIQMVIKVPRGTMALYESKPTPHYYSYDDIPKMSAIKAFVEEHKNDCRRKDRLH